MKVMKGWFKFHRKIFDNPVCTKDSEYFYVWCWLLTYAKYEEERFLFCGEDIILQKGQLITTTKEISNQLKINESKVRRILKSFKNNGQIDIQTGSRNTLVTVLNWDYYQGGDEQNDGRVTDKCQSSDGVVTDECRTNGKPSYYNKKYKKERIKEEKKEVFTAQTETVDNSEIRTILEAWNDLEHYGIKPVTKLKSTTERYDRLKARIKEYGIDDVLTAIENVKQSDFLQGKNNKGWTVTFDWFVRPNNFPKVLEGNYINNTPNANMNFTESPKNDQFQKLMEQIRRDEENANRGC